MTIFPATVSGGGSASGDLHGTASSTMSAHRAASATVIARAFGPSSETSADSEDGPRELLTATSCPAFAKRRAVVAPIIPAPMMPIFMSVARCRAAYRAIDLPDRAKMIGEVGGAGDHFREGRLVRRTRVTDGVLPLMRGRAEPLAQRRPFRIRHGQPAPARAEIRVVKRLFAIVPAPQQSEPVAQVIDVCGDGRAAA